MNKQPPGNASYQLKKMVDVLASMKKTRNIDAKLLYEGLSGDAKKGLKDSLGEDVINQLESGQRPWSDLLTMLRSGDTEINERLINLDGKFFSIQSLHKLGRYIVYGDTRSLKEIQDFIVKKGFTNYLARRAGSYFLVWPILQGTLWSVWYAAMSKIEGQAEDLGFKDFNPVDYNESVPWYEIFKDELLKQFSLADIPQFLIPTYIDEFLLGMVDFLKGKNVESEDLEEEIKNEVEKQRIKVWTGFSNEEKQVMSDAAEATGNPDLIAVTEDGGGSSPKTETPITNPIEKEIRDGFPCAKKYPLKVISNTKVEFTNVSSGNEIILAEKINGVWTWTDTGLPLKCNK
jgi:hypothetical protein